MLALLSSVLFPCNKTAYLQGRNYLYKVFRYVCIIIIKDYCLHHTSSSIVHGRTSILRIPGWRWITRSGLAFLFGFSVPLPLGTAVRLYKDAFHRCFKFDPIPVVFLSLCYRAARMFLVRHFCYWSSVCPPHCATSFSLSKVITVLELQPVVRSPDQYGPLTYAQGSY